jgi:hypothetical protein
MGFLSLFFRQDYAKVSRIRYGTRLDDAAKGKGLDYV